MLTVNHNKVSGDSNHCKESIYQRLLPHKISRLPQLFIIPIKRNIANFDVPLVNDGISAIMSCYKGVKSSLLKLTLAFITEIHTKKLNKTTNERVN